MITERNRPLILFECKLSETVLSRPLIQLAQRLGGIPHVQLLRRFAEDVTKGSGRMVQADRYLVDLA